MIEQALKALYAEEINVQISSFWDGGWTVKIGDEMNGFSEEALFWNENFDKIAEYLHEYIIKVHENREKWIEMEKLARVIPD